MQQNIAMIIANYFEDFKNCGSGDSPTVTLNLQDLLFLVNRVYQLGEGYGREEGGKSHAA